MLVGSKQAYNQCPAWDWLFGIHFSKKCCRCPLVPIILYSGTLFCPLFKETLKFSIYSNV